MNRQNKNKKWVLPLIFGTLGLATASLCVSTLNTNTNNKNTITPTQQTTSTNIDLALNNVEDSKLSTINGQEIVNAIEAFKLNPSTSNNSNFYQFKSYPEQDIIDSLVNNIVSNVKYKGIDGKIHSLNPYTDISVTKNNYNNLYNVKIYTSKLNGGKIYYFKDFNRNFNEPNPIAEPKNQVIVSNDISFNAATFNSDDTPTLMVKKTMSSLNIAIIATSISVGALILALVILWIKKKNAGQYVH